MRIKTRKISRAQRILSHGSALTLVVMRPQTFSVCAMPQGARPAHTNFFLIHDCVSNVGFDTRMHNKIMTRIYIN